MIRRRRNRRGYSLIEIAIVMTMVAAITGAVFVAQSIMKNRHMASTTGEQLVMIGENMRNLYAGQNVAALQSTAATLAAKTALTQQLALQRVFPAQMVNVATNNVFSLWAQPVFIKLDKQAGLGAKFIVEYDGMSGEVCSKMLMANSSPTRESGLAQIVVTGANNVQRTYSGAAGQIPFMASDLPVVCGTGGEPYAVEWWYNFNQNCLMGQAC